MLIKDDEEYEIESETAMDIELKIRKEIETLKSFIHTHRQTQRTNNTVEEEINRPTHQVKLPKFEIKPFSGNPVEWTTFIESFTAAFDKNNFQTDIEKITYLIDFLRDEATTAVTSLQLNIENYSVALKMLEERFGNPQLLIHKHMTKLLSLEFARSMYDLKNLRKVYDEVETQVFSLENLDLDPKSYGFFLDLYFLILTKKNNTNFLK